MSPKVNKSSSRNFSPQKHGFSVFSTEIRRHTSETSLGQAESHDPAYCPSSLLEGKASVQTSALAGEELRESCVFNLPPSPHWYRTVAQSHPDILPSPVLLAGCSVVPIIHIVLSFSNTPRAWGKTTDALIPVLILTLSIPSRSVPPASSLGPWRELLPILSQLFCEGGEGLLASIW